MRSTLRGVGRGSGRALATARMCAWIALLTVAMPSGARAQQAGLRDTTLADSLPPAPAVQAKPAPPETAIRRSSSLTPFGEPRRRVERTFLPFAGNPAPRTYPDVSFGVGAAWYVSSFRGAEGAFRAVEDSIRRMGYSVPVTATVTSGPMYVLSMNLSATPRLGGTLQYGLSADRDNELLLVGGLLWSRWTTPAAPKVSLSAGAGGGVFRFSFNRKYGTVISPSDPTGSYTTLDYIRFEGHGAYATIMGRATAVTSSRSVFEGTLQYMGMGDVSKDIPGAGRQSINVSGLSVGLSYVVSF